ncbi:putative xylulokinase [Naematelia encephala]|uniref:Xylulose kinase n=1 Tax=Naematelia encephala TaxID=71784 RepID=A0A1Y2B8H2_9TREE|nr:putative xylulokinase [Naematelia encephala]
MTRTLGALFLGLDCSTQSLKASLLSADLDILREVAVNFDKDLPQYGTKGGVLYGTPGEVFSPVMLPVEAMDVLFERMQAAGWPLGQVKGVAAAGQQHASVYWSTESSKILSSVDPSRPLHEQLQGAFSRETIPNWQDSATTAECRAIEAAVGGPEALAEITGSKAYERFTGAQIMRFKRLEPQAYAATDRIGLVSSAITTLLCLDGEVKGIDESDVCGMNLWTMNNPARGWHAGILAAIAGKDGAEELARKLGTVERDGGRVVGKIGQWFVKRYGFNPECCVFPGTGDNPATFLSLTLRPSEGLVSLGTSDVVLVSTSSYNPHQEYHAFFHPAQDAESSQAGLRYFNMLVYKNGSLAREHVRDRYFDKSWERFNAAVQALRPKAPFDLPMRAAFWWLLPDIIPDGAHGVFKYISKPSKEYSLPSFEASAAKSVSDFPDVRAEALAILESQLLNYRSRSSTILGDSSTPFLPSSPGVPSSIPRLTRVYATGGASANRTILSLMSDVLSAPVCKNVEYAPETGWVDADWNACSVGVAYKARWGWERHVAGRNIGFDELVTECRQTRAARRGEVKTGTDIQEEGIKVVATPGPGSGAYERRVEWWRAMEERALRESKLAK